MSPHAYTEDQPVDQPATGLFAALGWQTVSALEETFGTGGTFSRETKGEVVLTVRLRAALTQLTPGLLLEATNREVCRLLKEGIPVSIPDREHGGQKTERLQP